MVTDLSVEADAITEKFGKDCRYKIRRAEAKDGLSMEFLTDPESRLDEFQAFYDAFAKEKSVAPSYHQWLEAAPWSGAPIAGFIGRKCCGSRRWE
jgi:hypothetical protein